MPRNADNLVQLVAAPKRSLKFRPVASTKMLIEMRPFGKPLILNYKAPGDEEQAVEALHREKRRGARGYVLGTPERVQFLNVYVRPVQFYRIKYEGE